MRKLLEAIRPQKPPRITLYRCGEDHIHFHPHSRCPVCDGLLFPVSCRGIGTLICRTKIEITPSGKSLTLGIARHKSGAKTLCRVVGNVRGNGNERVSMIDIDGLIHVYGRRTRVNKRGIAMAATHVQTQKSAGRIGSGALRLKQSSRAMS